MSKTFINSIDVTEVSLGLEHLLLAAHGTSWTPGRISIATPPTGFYHLGAVVEDSPTFTYSREYFELEVGVPKVAQYRAVVGVTGTFECALHSKSWRKFQYALANATIVNTDNGASYVEQIYGTSRIDNYALLGVVDFIDGSQIIHYLPKVSPNGDIVEEYRPEQNARIPLSYRALGEATVVGSCTQIIVGRRYTFPSVTCTT